MRTIAIMQPYFFPYLGYWQLMRSVDRFILLDDVNYINRGWINRNRILVNGAPIYITAPLSHASQNKRICDIALQPGTLWKRKLVKTIEIAYRRSAYFDEVFPLIEKLIVHEEDNLANYLAHQLQSLSVFMRIGTEFVASSRDFENEDLRGQERIVDICKREGANAYVNAQGGQSLYDAEAFREAGVTLRFILMRPITYVQESGVFVPNLSIIDLLMAIGQEAIDRHLQAYELMIPRAVMT